MAEWAEILAATGAALRGEAEGRGLLLASWATTSETDHAQRCVLAHYLADLEDDVADEVAWDERALDAFGTCGDGDLAAIGIASARAMAPSLHLNLGDGYLRQGRLAEARDQLRAGLGAIDALPDDGYGAHVARGLQALGERLEASPAELA